MTDHTPEPWVYDPERGGNHDFIIHREEFEEEHGEVRREDGVVGCSEWLWLDDADARRIVACVNACSGLSNNALEGGIIEDMIETLTYIHETTGEAQNRDACERILARLGDGDAP